MIREMVDEAPVEVAEPEERMDLHDVPRDRPLRDTRDLDRIHGDAIMGDNQAQVFH